MSQALYHQMLKLQSQPQLSQLLLHHHGSMSQPPLLFQPPGHHQLFSQLHGFHLYHQLKLSLLLHQLQLLLLPPPTSQASFQAASFKAYHQALLFQLLSAHSLSSQPPSPFLQAGTHQSLSQLAMFQASHHQPLLALEDHHQQLLSKTHGSHLHGHQALFKASHQALLSQFQSKPGSMMSAAMLKLLHHQLD